MRRWLPILLLVLLAGPARAGEPVDPARVLERLKDFFAEEDPAQRAMRGYWLASHGGTPAQLAAALPQARTWPADAPKGDVTTWERKTADGVAHTIYAAIPEAYDGAKAWPVLVWLHGGVSRDRDEGGIFGVQIFNEIADEQGFLVLSPSTRTGAAWWTPNGVALVRGALDDLKKRWHVDADRVAVSGFSDGASGCYHLLAHDPDPYCCFLPLMAHPGVTRLVGGPSFAANVRSRPVMAFNGGQDPLYPSVRIKPMIDELKAAGCDITWTDLPEAGHQIPSVLPEHWPALHDFWKAHPREPLAPHVAWETALPETEGRFGWVEILAVDPEAPSATDLPAAVLPDPAGRPRLGIQLDQEHRGPGLAIGEVQKGTAADEAGFLVGDVIVKVDGKVLEAGPAALVALRQALEAMADRDGVFTVKRGDEEVEIRTRPRPVTSALQRPAGLGYDQPSGRIDARVAKPNEIHVRTRHVGRFRLHLAPGLVDLAKPLRVLVNGALRHEGPAPGNASYLLTEAVRAGPGAPAWQATLVLAP